jgi:hypothetical protein
MKNKRGISWGKNHEASEEHFGRWSEKRTEI